MTTILNNPLMINGVISTNKTALQNLNTLTSSAGAFLTYDISQGKWAVIINTIGSSVKSYNDSNIIGSINVTETGVSELYNSVSLEFPHRSLRDQTDFVELTIPLEDRFPNEVDNILNIQVECINDPIQAQYIAGIELKQSRLNKIITFTTDYTSLGLKAGDLIDVTTAMYGYTNKLFRVTKLEEIDEDIIGLAITAQEYSESIYDTSGLVAVEKNKKTGILLKQQNTELQRLDDVDTGNQLERLLLANAGALLLKSLFNRILGTDKFGPSTLAAKNVDKILAGASSPVLSSVINSGDVCEGGIVTITASSAETVANCPSSCLFPLPNLEYQYSITGVTESDINVPLTGTIIVNGSSKTGSLVITTSATSGGDSSNIMTVTVGGLPTDVVIYDSPPYDYIASASPLTITEGSSTTITLDVLNVAIGTSVPYAITGSTGRISSPSLTGNVTINSAYQATVTINTTTTSGHTGNDTFTVTFAPDLSSPCLDNAVSITVNDSTPFQPSTTCQYIEVPIIWCAEYNGYDNQLQSVTPLEYARFAVPLNGESSVAIPTELSVTKGNPSSIGITATANVASSLELGGLEISVITTFNTVQPKGLITGTTTSLKGYL